MDTRISAGQTLLKHSHGAFLYLSQARIAVAEDMLDLTQPASFQRIARHI